MRKMLFLVLVVGLLVGAVAMVSAKQSTPLLSGITHLLQKKTQVAQVSSEDGNVLGEQSDQVNSSGIQGVGEKIGDTVGPVLESIGNSVSQFASTVTEKVTTDDQKIQIDKAVEDAKNRASEIPGEVFDKAKYEYCKQVVEDYEKR